MKRMCGWLVICALFSLSHVSQVCARGVPEVTPANLQDGTITNSVLTITDSVLNYSGQCRHTIHPIVSPEEVTGTWYWQELISGSPFFGNFSCFVSNISINGTQIIVKTSFNNEVIQGETDNEREYIDTLEQTEDGMWEAKVNVCPGKNLLGISPKGLLVWCCSPNPLHHWNGATILYAREPATELENELIALEEDSQTFRYHSACLPTSP